MLAVAKLSSLERETVREGGPQVGNPHRVRVEVSEERSTHQRRIAGLDHVQDEDKLAGDLRDAIDAYLAGRRRHRRSAYRAAEARDTGVGVAEDLRGAGEWYGEVTLRPGVALNEHVVRHHSKPQLHPPHLGPTGPVIVNGPDQRSLSTNDGTCAADSADRVGHDQWLQLAWMREVRHQRHRLPRRADLLKQPECVVGVGVSQVALRPVGQRFGADAYRFEVVEARV